MKISNLINNKEKQFSGGNYGHPRKFVKRKTKIADPLIPEIPRQQKEKKHHKPYVFPRSICPFCKNELKIVKKGECISWLNKYESECRNCGAKEVEECPACKKNTWRNSNGVYKHQDRTYTCGFEGGKIWKKGD